MSITYTEEQHWVHLVHAAQAAWDVVQSAQWADRPAAQAAYDAVCALQARVIAEGERFEAIRVECERPVPYGC